MGLISNKHDNEYIATLEAAVLDAEWWLSDYKVAAQKDPRGERKKSIYHAADLIRERKKEKNG